MSEAGALSYRASFVPFLVVSSQSGSFMLAEMGHDPWPEPLRYMGFLHVEDGRRRLLLEQMAMLDRASGIGRHDRTAERQLNLERMRSRDLRRQVERLADLLQEMEVQRDNLMDQIETLSRQSLKAERSAAPAQPLHRHRKPEKPPISSRALSIMDRDPPDPNAYDRTIDDDRNQSTEDKP